MAAPTKRLYLGGLNPDCQKEDLEQFFSPRPLVDIRIISVRRIPLEMHNCSNHLQHKGFGFVEFESLRDAEDVIDSYRGRDFMGERLVIDFAKEQRRDRDDRFGGPPPPRDYRDRGDRYDRYDRYDHYDRYDRYDRYSDRGGRDYDRYGGGDRYGGDRYGGDRYGGDRYGGDRYGGDRYGGGDRYDRYPRDDYGPPREKRGPRPNTGFKVFVQGISEETSWQDLKDFGRDGGAVTRADVDRSIPGQGVIEFASKYDAEDAVAKLDNTELKGVPVQVVADAAEPPASGGGWGGARERSPPRRSSRYDDYDSRPPPPRREDAGFDRYERERSPPPPADE
ncbi:hypothetical protein E3P98_03712 [Wallemia ichthyophaga]|nr:hypothetical protein E3P98_03712 [Wallemia ichthyophaga]